MAAMSPMMAASPVMAMTAPVVAKAAMMVVTTATEAEKREAPIGRSGLRIDDGRDGRDEKAEEEGAPGQERRFVAPRDGRLGGAFAKLIRNHDDAPKNVPYKQRLLGRTAKLSIGGRRPKMPLEAGILSFCLIFAR
jgi:hypothetical protein